METPEPIECDSGKHKSAELVCRVARGMQEQGNAVSFSEIEDAVVNIHKLGSQVQDDSDLKDIMRPALAKTDKAAKSFNQIFPNALAETFHSKTKIKKSEDTTAELVNS